MADDDDLDYSDTNVGSAQTQHVRKNISIKLKGKGRGGRGKRGGRGRRSTSKKTVIGVNEDNNEETRISDDVVLEKGGDKQISDLISYDDVISKFEASSLPFSPMDRSFPEILHQNKKLQWNHKVNLIGEKVVDPTIHCCENCSLPILNYGRVIPCKHAACYDCAKKSEKMCLKCKEKPAKVEQNALGTIFMCTFGGSKCGPIPCGRTYLSERDLQAHMNHRHLKPPPAPAATGASTIVPHSSPSYATTTVLSTNPIVTHTPIVTRDPRDPRGHTLHDVPHSSQSILNSHNQHSHRPLDHRDQNDHSGQAIQAESGQQRQYPHSPANYQSTIPVSSARPNLITVPIQDDSSAGPGLVLPPHAAHYPPSVNTANHPLPSHVTNSYPLPPHGYPPQALQPTAPAYSQAPHAVITTQTFSPHAQIHHAPPPSIHPPNAPGGLYSTPPPTHSLPPVGSYTIPPQANANPHPPQRHLHPPQRFPGAAPAGFKEPYNIQPWNPGNVPPPTRGALQPPARPIAPPPSSNHPHIPPRGPSDAGYRTSYYQ